MIISNANRLQNDSHCKLYLPFSNSVTEELSKGKSETHTVTNNGSVAITTVSGRKCASFNGTSQYLSIPDSDDFHFGSGDFTLSLWAYLNSFTASTPLIGQWGNTDQDSFFLYTPDGNSLSLIYSANGTDNTFFNISQSLSVETWYNIMIVRYGAWLVMFLDGNQIGSSYNIGTASLFNSTQPLHIGYLSDTSDHLNGYLSGVQIHEGIARHLHNFTPQERGI